MNELALFAGAGGGLLAGKLLGWRTVCAVEWGEYPASVLCARQNEGLLPPFPIWSDVQTFDGKPWRGRVDVVSGGFPCQDISVAGKGAGIDGERSGMWSHMARIIGEVRPRFAFVENSPALISRGLGRVLGDLAALGYDCRWGVLGAADVGAPHQRDRFWLVGRANTKKHGLEKRETAGGLRDESADFCEVATNTDRIVCWDERQKQVQSYRSMDKRQTQLVHDGDKEYMANAIDSGIERWQQQQECSAGAGDVAYTTSQRQPQQRQCPHASSSAPYSCWEASHADHDGKWWAAEPNVGRVANGVAARVDRLKAIGNGQVPLCAATAWRLLGGV